MATSTATDTVIVKNGAIFQQEGNPAPGVSGGWILTGFGTGPVDLDDQGNVFWFGDWNDTDTTRDTGIYRNDQLLVQEGVTRIRAHVLRESLVRIERLPLFARVPSLPELEAGTHVEIDITGVDLLGLDLDCRFVGKAQS